MGIDYSAIGGIGIEFTDEMAESAVEKGLFTEEDWEEAPDECVDCLNIEYGEAGYLLAEQGTFYLLVEGRTLDEVNSNVPEFIAKLAAIGVTITPADLIVISEYVVS